MKTKNTLVIGIVLFFAAFTAKAQDIHFSQFTSAPLQLNPAMAGLNECDYRLAANFKAQWGNVSDFNYVYRTVHASYDQALGKHTNYSNFGGFGISLFSDMAGDVNFNTHRVEMSLGYHLMLDNKGSHTLSMAINGGVGQRSFNQTKSTFNSQWQDGEYNPNAPTGETFDYDTYIYGDVGVGVVWNISPTKVSNYYLGLSLTHLNQPNQSFFEDETEQLYMKTTFHGGALMPFGDNISLMPSFMVLKQGPSHEINIGTYIKYKMGNLPSDNTAFYIGAWYRLADAAVIAARVDVGQFDIGLSYDVNISKLTTATNANGGPEISLIYNGCLSKKSRPLFCPQL